MANNLFRYFKKSDNYELPNKWLTEPLPSTPPKRPVGRPAKKSRVDDVLRSSSDSIASPDVPASPVSSVGFPTISTATVSAINDTTVVESSTSPV